MVLFGVLLIIAIITFLSLNTLVKRTNWWKNIFIFTKQFNGDSFYDIVNVGSNPARFAFFYEDVLGENWSTGTQGLDMDLEILKCNIEHLTPGAYVLLPIVPFSSVSGYLTDYSMPYIAKFAHVLGHKRLKQLPELKNGSLILRYPLFFNWRAVKYIIRDVNVDTRINQSEQSMQLVDIEIDARRWMKVWSKEFKIKDLLSPLPNHLIKGRDRSVLLISETIDYLRKLGFKPILVSPPMSKQLSVLFTPQILDTYVYSFIRLIRERNDVLYLDYISDEELSNSENYINALFMNLRGRKVFTRRVLSDLGLNYGDRQ